MALELQKGKDYKTSTNLRTFLVAAEGTSDDSQGAKEDNEDQLHDNYIST
jgi:hypothetical protein